MRAVQTNLPANNRSTGDLAPNRQRICSQRALAVGPVLHLLAQRVGIPGHGEDQDGVDHAADQPGGDTDQQVAVPSDERGAVKPARSGTPMQEIRRVMIQVMVGLPQMVYCAPQFGHAANRTMMFITRSATMPRRRTFTAEFNSQPVLKVTPPLRACASVSGEQSAAELCRQHQIKPQLLSDWKVAFLAIVAMVFQGDSRLHEAEQRIAEPERHA